MAEILLTLLGLAEYRMLAAGLLLAGGVSWGVARLLLPMDKEGRQILWSVAGAVGFVAVFASGGRAGSLPALFLCPWAVFPDGSGLEPLASLLFWAVCGFPVCLFLAGQLDLLREELAAGKSRWLGPLFCFCAVAVFYAIMLHTRGAALAPFRAPHSAFFTFAMAAAAESSYLDRELRRKRGLAAVPVAAAIALFAALAVLDNPASLFFAPMLPLNFCYSVARFGPGDERLGLETALERTERELESAKRRIDELWRPETARAEPAEFWMLPDAPDSEIMGQLAADGRMPRSGGEENGENILDSVLEG